MEWTRESGSFRDPSGFVFTLNGVVFRRVNADFGHCYRQLIDSGLYDELVRDGLLVSHEEVDLEIAGAPPPYAILKPSPIPFVSLETRISGVWPTLTRRYIPFTSGIPIGCST